MPLKSVMLKMDREEGDSWLEMTAECSQFGEATVQLSLSNLESRLGDVDAARQHFENALNLCEAVCSRLGIANVQISDF
jgi:hypothetical protein